MSTIGEIKTLYKDKEQSQAIFPRTKVSAISNESGVELNALMEDKASKDYVATKIKEAQYPDWSNLTWYVMGDEITAQDNEFTTKHYYDYIHEKTGINLIIDGKSGAGYVTSTDTNKSFLERAQGIPQDVDIITIFGSSNDLPYTKGENDPIWHTLSYLTLQKPGVPVIIVPPLPQKGYNKREEPWLSYCERIQTCALACDLRYFSDMYNCSNLNGNHEEQMNKFFTNDPSGKCPNEEGHKILAQLFYNALNQELSFKV